MRIEAPVPATTEPSPLIRVRPAEFTVHRSGDSTTSLVVALSYSGTAKAGGDYEALPERIEFPPGQAAVTLQVRAIDDEEVEVDEFVIATIVLPADPNTATYLPDRTRSSARVVIHDSDRPVEPEGVVSIEATRRISEETAAPLRRLNLVGEFTITRTGPSERSLPVWLHISGSATPQRDYEPLPLLATIPAGEATLALPVRAVLDELPEGIETVNVEISNCPPDGILAPCYFFNIDPARSRDTVFIREDGLTSATLHLNAPRDGASFRPGQAIRIEAVAVDLDSYISRVDFCVGERLLGTSEIHFLVAPDPGTPVTHEFVWENAPPGDHLLTAKATLTNKESIVSSPTRITVGDSPPPGNIPPSVRITRPAPGEAVPADQALLMVVESQDPDGWISLVEFFANNRKIGEQTMHFLVPPPPGQPQPFRFLWQHPEPGRQSLTVKVTDQRGASSTSPPVEVTVSTADALPMVSVIARDGLAVEPAPGTDPDPASFWIRRHGSTSGDLEVPFSLHGQAENGIDYEEVTGRVVIPDGHGGVEVRITPLADNSAEGPESVILQLESAPGFHLGDPRRAHAVIYPAKPDERPPNPWCVRLENALFHLCFPAEGGNCFRVEVSTNLREWTTLFCLISEGGAVHLVQERSPGSEDLFFRIRPEPSPLPPLPIP